MHDRVLAAYFVSWGIYARDYHVSNIPAGQLNHILYAFAKVREDGKVQKADKWADTDKHYPDDSWNDTGKNLYGNLKQLALLKRKHRSLKVSLSIGGWTYREHFPTIAADPSRRRRFVESAIRLLENFGLDGLDIDWEYPQSQGDALNFVTLLSELRKALTEYQQRKGDSQPYLLTCAMPCGEDNYRRLCLREMVPLVDWFYMMAYDFSGSWSNKAGHQANMFGDEVSVYKAVEYYRSQGVPQSHMVVGMPIYGRAFQNTQGLGHPYNGVGSGTWEQGVYDYKKLPLEGAQVHFDEKAGASFSYDPVKKELVSYDTPDLVYRKAKWIVEGCLRGAMFWELSADRSEPNESLVAMALQGLGGPEALERTENHLNFPKSKYDNVRRGFC